MSKIPHFTAFALEQFPMIGDGDDILAIIQAAVQSQNAALQDGDILVIASKIVSKAEGRWVSLWDVQPNPQAIALAQETNKDPRIVQLVLNESRMVSRKAPNVLVTEHRLGFVSANAGIDQSNVGKDDAVLLLPNDPDGTAQIWHNRIKAEQSIHVAVVISDTHGRPFRLGNVGVAIGVAGMQALVDQRGEYDLFGRELVATIQGYADMVASAAHLLTGEGAEGLPVVVLRGLSLLRGDGRASDLYRDASSDLYR